MSRNDKVPDESPFTTPSDIVNSLNQVLSSMNDDNDRKESFHQAGSQTKKTYFELQKRFQDGSSRPATEAELKSADAESKLKQVANHVANLKTWKEKEDFYEAQRQYGNQLYTNEKYEQAIDVYLTCLLVAQEKPEMLCCVMNNLAQTALKLGWYSKTEQFCSIALEKESQYPSKTQLVKLYYKRGKALRLRGEYKRAKADQQAALRLVMQTDDDDKEQVSNTERKAIEKELSLIAKSAAEGKRNQKRAQMAIQKEMVGAKGDGGAVEAKAERKGLYDQGDGRRKYSTLRAPHEDVDDASSACSSTSDDLVVLSYWQTYLVIVGRLARRILQILGDEEDVEGEDGTMSTRRYKDD